MLLDPDRLNGLSATFRKNAGEIESGTTITPVYGAGLPGHVLRIYEVDQMKSRLPGTATDIRFRSRRRLLRSGSEDIAVAEAFYEPWIPGNT